MPALWVGLPTVWSKIEGPQPTAAVLKYTREDPIVWRACLAERSGCAALSA